MQPHKNSYPDSYKKSSKSIHDTSGMCSDSKRQRKPSHFVSQFDRFLKPMSQPLLRQCLAQCRRDVTHTAAEVRPDSLRGARHVAYRGTHRAQPIDTLKRGGEKAHKSTLEI
ncbi:hypothetical protein DPEC_G00244590 [Dallia pectoralis]|uniref:Uncharacterized protein n=1 Tax=Dallia pectoralis TaxID=75939 RepID=A0ACC2FVR8_DALPE|nr:hypothetical protein DPEC_G00244590 [Dallia pectoralis]